MLAVSQHHWYSLSWVDWLNVVAFPLAIIGIILAFWQARIAATKAREIEKAMRGTEREIRQRQLILLIPQLRIISSQLDEAISSNNVQLVRQHLENWRSQVVHVRGILLAADSERQDLQKGIQQSVALTATAISDILKAGTSSIDVFATCQGARERISKTCDALAFWLGQSSTSTHD